MYSVLNAQLPFTLSHVGYSKMHNINDKVLIFSLTSEKACMQLLALITCCLFWTFSHCQRKCFDLMQKWQIECYKLRRPINRLYLYLKPTVLNLYSAATPWWPIESCGDPKGPNNRIHPLHFISASIRMHLANYHNYDNPFA